MRVNSAPFRVSLAWGRPLTVAEGKGTCITARRGTVWITQDHDLRDVVLSVGESFMLDGSDLAIVQAFGSAEVLVSPPPAPAHSAAPVTWRQRLRRAWQRNRLTGQQLQLGKLAHSGWPAH